MNYKLKVISASELGKRTNQEDSIYPEAGKSDDGNGLFILCDGMGGHESGEVASSTVCEVMSRHINESSSEAIFTESDFKEALSAAFDALDEKDNGTDKKMGTTMTFLKFHEGGCMMAHIGDSRIYHIRPSEYGEARILHVTRDHSLVNDLVAIGELTPEQAKVSRQRNVITRAMQPSMENRPKADITHITDVRPGDYFYMCSDGMLEQMDDMELADVLSMDSHSDEEKMEMLLSLTAENKDNHSFHMIHVIGVDGHDVESMEVSEPEEEDENDKALNRSRMVSKILFLLVFATVVFSIFYFASDWLVELFKK